MFMIVMIAAIPYIVVDKGSLHTSTLKITRQNVVVSFQESCEAPNTSHIQQPTQAIFELYCPLSRSLSAFYFLGGGTS